MIIFSFVIFILYGQLIFVGCAEYYVDGVDGNDIYEEKTLNNCTLSEYPCRTILHISENLCDMLKVAEGDNTINFIKGVEVLRNISYIDCVHINRIDGPGEPMEKPTITFSNETGIDLPGGYLQGIHLTGHVELIVLLYMYDCDVFDMTTEGNWRVETIHSSHFKNFLAGETLEDSIVALFTYKAFYSTFENFVWGNMFGNILTDVVGCTFLDNKEIFYNTVDRSASYVVKDSTFIRNEYILEQKITFYEQLNRYQNCKFINNTQFGKIDGGRLELIDSEVTYNAESGNEDYYWKLYNGVIHFKNTNVNMNGGNSSLVGERNAIYVLNKKGADTSVARVELMDLELKGDGFTGVYASRPKGMAHIALTNVGLAGHGTVGVRTVGRPVDVKLDGVKVDCGCEEMEPIRCDEGGVFEISENCEFGENYNFMDLVCKKQECTYNGTMFDGITCPGDHGDHGDDGKKKEEESSAFKNLATVAIVIVLFSCAACFLLVLLVVGIVLGVLRCWYVQSKKGVKYKALQEEDDEERMAEGDTESEDELELEEINDMELLD